MASSSLKFNSDRTSIYCMVRRRFVAAEPEEEVRQRILLFMTETLGYDASSLAVERSVSSLVPPLAALSGSLPNRRVDIVCFHAGAPLLLIECKAVPLKDSAALQVAGYNHFIKAPYIAIANAKEVRTYWQEGSSFKSVGYLPARSLLPQ